MYYKRKEAGKIKHIPAFRQRKKSSEKELGSENQKISLKKAQDENLLSGRDTPPDSEGDGDGEINLGI